MTLQIYKVVEMKHGSKRVLLETSNVFQAFALVSQLTASAWQGGLTRSSILLLTWMAK
jgi:hypothetical protein